MPDRADNRFERDTRVIPVRNGEFEARIDPGWWILAGPNGGYVAAILLRAMEQAVGDPERAARSFTIHFVTPPAEGKAKIETQIERTGRSLTTVTARMWQDGRILCVGVAAFSKAREGLTFDHTRAPDVPPPEACEPMPAVIEIHQRYEHRWAVDVRPWGGGDEARSGGWIRLAEPRIADAALVAAYTDAFPPAVFSMVQEGAINGPVPTVELTVHFRESLPRAEARPEEFTLALFRSRYARGGFVEEDGEIWSADGVLLAQSRQLALVL
jgi:acyl-CoA thioesterase